MTTAVLAFSAAAALVIVVPGPDTLLVTRNVFRGGRVAGIATVAGIMIGLVAWSAAAMLGLSALLAASRVGYDAARVAGGIYLVWLGVQSLRAGCPGRGELACPATYAGKTRLGRAFASGAVSNLLNPKVGIFFVAFLPGFIPASAPVMATALLLVAIFLVEGVIWLGLLVWLLGRGAGWLHRDGVTLWLERLSGVVLVGLGLRIATDIR